MHVVFGICEDPSEILALRSAVAEGNCARLSIDMHGISIRAAAAAVDHAVSSPTAAAAVAVGKLPVVAEPRSLVQIRDATIDTCGPKAAMAGRLEVLAASSVQEFDGFKVPASTALPFGAMLAAAQHWQQCTPCLSSTADVDPSPGARCAAES